MIDAPDFQVQMRGPRIVPIRLDASPDEFAAEYDAASLARMALRCLWVKTFKPGQPASLAPF